MIVGYYYLLNDNLVFQKGKEPTDLRENPGVGALWPLDPLNRDTSWTILVEALAAGVSESRIRELGILWNCNDVDAMLFAERSRFDLVRGSEELDQPWMASSIFEYAIGNTAIGAIAALLIRLGYEPTKSNENSFKSLLEQEARRSDGLEDA